MAESEIQIHFDTSELDAAVDKAMQLVSILREANDLAASLSGQSANPKTPIIDRRVAF